VSRSRLRACATHRRPGCNSPSPCGWCRLAARILPLRLEARASLSARIMRLCDGSVTDSAEAGCILGEDVRGRAPPSGAV
jgi:hypothetical protein